MLVVAVNDENPNVPGVTIDGPQTMSVTEGQSVTLRCDTKGKKGPFNSVTVYPVTFAMISFSLFTGSLLNHKILNAQKLCSVLFSNKNL